MKEGRALVALIILFFMVVVDPVISYVRRRWYDDTPYYSPPRKTFLTLAYGVPIFAVIVGLTVSLFRIEDYRRGLLIVAIQLLFGGSSDAISSIARRAAPRASETRPSNPTTPSSRTIFTISSL